jgi:hypothetical protein
MHGRLLADPVGQRLALTGGRLGFAEFLELGEPLPDGNVGRIE